MVFKFCYVFWLISIVLLSRNGVLPNLGEKLFAKISACFRNTENFKVFSASNLRYLCRVHSDSRHFHYEMHVLFITSHFYFFNVILRITFIFNFNDWLYIKLKYSLSKHAVFKMVIFGTF